ncbi:hypothetical protein [Corynebacterium cystitidis]|uniref:hypothetical protein n=1 Tax=Corynebacterium cystitidis TaxID=35757 RepID=UPI00211E9409|nr:hypothetical protein [Corynebacterium cystitidis]
MDENKTYEIAGYKFVDDGRFDSHAADVELWGQSVPVVLETDGDVSDADLETRVAQKLEWVEENRADIEAEFLKEQGHHIDIVNDLILNGKFAAPNPSPKMTFLKRCC